MMGERFRLLFARTGEALRVLKGESRTRLRGRRGSARVAILTITEGEFDAARKVFGLQHNVPRTPYFVRELLEDDTYDVVLRRAAAQGNIEAGRAVGDFVEDLRPEYVFLVGTAGGSGKDGGAVGDVVVSDVVEYYEHRKYVEGQDLPRRTPCDPPSLYARERFVEPLRVSAGWIERIPAEFVRPVAGLPKLLIGEIVAGEKLLGDADNAFQKNVMKVFDKALAFDMESWGVAKEIYRQRGTPRYNPQYLVIRGLSDIVTDDLNDAIRKQWRDYAAAAAAAAALSVVQSLLEDTGPDW